MSPPACWHRCAAGVSAGHAGEHRRRVAADPGQLRVDGRAGPLRPTKIDAARAALGGVVDALSDGATVGVRAYGGTFEDKARGCGDSRLVVPMGELDRAAAKVAFAGLRPLGFTPIAASLERAAGDFTGAGARRILLVSDGEETCGGNPCQVAKALEASGIDLTVGYAADAATKQQLACIAEATGGTYSEVADGEALQRELSRTALRAYREFQPTGTPVTGTPTAAGAPALEPGQYVDSFAVGEKKFYEVALPAGVTPYLAATTVLPRVNRSGYTYDLVSAQLSNAQGVCQDGTDRARTFSPSTSVVMMDQITDGLTTKQFGCGSPGTYLLEVERRGSDGNEVPRLQAELLVLLEPPVEDAATLPESVASVPLRLPPTPPVGQGAPVSGAGTFGGAPVLLPGTYSDALRPGETSYYRVPVGWGQRLNLTAVFAPTTTGREVVRSGINATMSVYNPARQEVDVDETTGRTSVSGSFRFIGNTDLQLHGWTAPYTWRHRESRTGQIGTTSLAGEQYVELSMGKLIGGQEEPPAGIPVRLVVEVVEVVGEASGAPRYRDMSGTVDSAAPVPSETRTTPEPESGGDAQPGSNTSDTRRNAYAGGGVLAALLAGGLLLLPWLRGRRRS